MILHYGDLTDSSNLVKIVSDVQPTEVYNLGAQSHVKVSFDMPGKNEVFSNEKSIQQTLMVWGLYDYSMQSEFVDCPIASSFIRLLQVNFMERCKRFLRMRIRRFTLDRHTVIFFINESGIAKQYAFWMVINYREAYNMFACNGILFNHESPRRGQTFVTRKISRAVANIFLGNQECLYLGNLEAKRDWGHAKDYVYVILPFNMQGMWLMLQQDIPQDFVLATGQTFSVRTFVEEAFKTVGVTIE